MGKWFDFFLFRNSNINEINVSRWGHLRQWVRLKHDGEAKAVRASVFQFIQSMDNTSPI
jgi:hypothetical protein